MAAVGSYELQRKHMWQLTTTTAEQTQALGAQIGERLVGGEVIAVTGPLGSGKTCLIQGIGAGLHVTDRVTSPTFVLIRRYQGRVRLYHVDAYRLENADAALQIGLPELVQPDSVVVIEWADHIIKALPEQRLDIQMAHIPQGRSIALKPHSERWKVIVEELETIARVGD